MIGLVSIYDVNVQMFDVEIWRDDVKTDMWR